MRTQSMQAVASLMVVLALSATMIGCDDSDNTAPAATATATGLPPTVTPVPSPTPTTNPILSLPLDETIHLPGLGGATDVVVDELGIPHIFGPDLNSVLFVQGYLTAASRFWSMDAFRRVAEGRLSELFGNITIPTDVAMRTEFTTRDGRRLEEALWQYAQQVDSDLAVSGQAYADGVNAWLADLRAGRNGATLPPEYQLFLINLGPNDLAEWRPQDTIAIGRLQAWSLSETLDDDIAAALRATQLPEALRLDLFRSAPATSATTLPVAQTGGGSASVATVPPAFPPAQVLRDVSALLNRVAAASPFGRKETGVGSNNWIVSPQMSANGLAMLANDPHLQLFNPPIWFMQQLDSGGADGGRVNGVNFPGLPGVILGHTDSGAWGATVAEFDVTDVYVETVTTPPDYPASPRTVLYKGQQVPVLRIVEQFNQKGGDPLFYPIEIVPHHGPMVPDPNLDDAVDGLA
ncbi:MAG TPA: penicillin acylase family protein, partial [Candidatus Kryptonia bacterium]|nr:penicillin acylase family protein [Candidatus Kryptonia bacterium]